MKPAERLSDCLDEWGPDLSERVRRAPWASVFIAAGLGYLMRFVPLRAVRGVLAKMGFALLQPALLIFGVIRLTQFLRGKKPDGFPATDLEFSRSLDSD